MSDREPETGDSHGAENEERRASSMEDWEVPGPRMRRRRLRYLVTIVMVVVWVVFQSVWLWSYASFYSIWQNIAVAMATLILLGGSLGAIWTDIVMPVVRMRAQASLVISVSWMAYVIIWSMFYGYQYSIYFNMAVILASIVLYIVLTASVWLSLREGERRISVDKRTAVSVVAFVLWSAFIIYWLLSQGNPNYWEHDAAVGVLSLIVLLVAMSKIWVPWSRRGHMGNIRGVVALFVWLVVLFVWFQFFALPYNFYQSLAVVIISLVIIMGIGALLDYEQQKD